MIKKLLISILFIPLIGNSQSLLKGRIIDSVSDAGIAGVTIHNISQHFYKKTETGGYFSILANKDDTLSFSNIGYFARHITSNRRHVSKRVIFKLNDIP
jgi:hypothetical protein